MPHPTVWTWRFGAILITGAAFLFGALAAYQKTLEARAVGVAADLVRESRLDAPDVATVTRAVRDLKLVTVTIDTTVKVTRRDDNWRGGAEATVEAPVRLHYGTDLSKLDVRHIVVNPLTGICIIRVPPPERIATEVFTEKERNDVLIGWGRFRSRAGEYQLGLARTQLNEQARQMTLSPTDQLKVVESTREQVQVLVERVLGPGRQVLVRAE